MSQDLLLFFPGAPEATPCKGRGGGETKYLPRDRQKHYARLSKAFTAVWEQKEQQPTVAVSGKEGLYLEIKSAAGYDLATKSLDSTKGTYSLLNVRHVGLENEQTTIATIYIPKENKTAFVTKLTEYATKPGKGGKPKNASLIESIEEICMAVLDDFWTDAPSDIPQESPTWCEIWLRNTSTESESAFSSFSRTAEALGIEINSRANLAFPERIVTLAKITRANFHQLLLHSPYIAECRLAREPAAFFAEQSPREQAEWVTEFLKKVAFAPEPQVSVCVLDTGVNNGHPLLQPVLGNNDLHTVDSEWGTHDHHGHGTGMAGIAVYGNLADALASTSAPSVDHCLESSKILTPRNDSPPELYGLITAKGITNAEDAAPHRKRQICMAVTGNSPFAQRGEPSSWSAAIDALASGANEPHSPKRLILISAGNTSEDEYSEYPDSNLSQSVQDPAQAWNALTVGAYTVLDKPDPSLGYRALASCGQLSPYSATSKVWLKEWPVKPDVLFEGGNIAVDAKKNCNDDERLSVLTTSHRTPSALLKPFAGTSAAVAEAACFAAKVQTLYPDAWPETIRALMVHSAEWTPAMRQQFTTADSKTQFAELRKVCGYGVPSLDRALYCKKNSLVLVAEREIQPYVKKEGRSDYGMQMHLFPLPWPVEALQDLGAAQVTLRMTLSYFIEPGPGQRGWKDKYRYASHGLRFELCGAQEETDQFQQRISNIIEEEEKNSSEVSRSAKTSERWVIGKNGRSSGSIHSDFYTGSAAEIAACNCIAVFPVVGWWRKRTHLKKMENTARYSLIVSLHTEAQNVDIYTPVKIQIENMVKTPVPISV